MANNLFIIETERLTLRPLKLNDLESAHEYASDVENTKYMIYLPNTSIQETKQFLQRVVSEWAKDTPAFYEFAVTLDGKHIGAVSISLDEGRQEGELGWIINKPYQGNGYATEAAEAVLNFALNKLNIKKAIAHCDYRNKPSCRVMSKIGLALESDNGLRRYKGSNEDIKELVYSLTVDK